MNPSQCDHERLEFADHIRFMVELWACLDCDAEFTRCFYGPDGDFEDYPM